MRDRERERERERGREREGERERVRGGIREKECYAMIARTTYSV